MHDGEEDDRRDHHLHEIDKRVAEGLERLGGVRGYDAQQNAERDRDEHLKSQVPEEARDHVGG